MTAVNEGGESFPSEVVAACRMPDEKGTVLIVNGFDRVSAPLSMRRDSLAGFYVGLDGGVPDRQDISYIGEQRVFDMSMAKCEVDSIALGACCCDYETEVIGGIRSIIPMCTAVPSPARAIRSARLRCGPSRSTAYRRRSIP